MKVEEIFPREGISIKKAKRIRAEAKKKSKKNNPDDETERAGWSVDPHQGYYNELRMTR